MCLTTNTSKANLWKLVFLTSIVIALFITTFHLYYPIGRRASNALSTGSFIRQQFASYLDSDKNFPFQILYLTQTEKCLPKFLQSPEVIGDTAACQCDVLVLSYKEECKDTPLPHVKYIFHPSTTWNTGRNLLYASAKARNKFYFYYVFMDDDIKLQTVEKGKKNAWRMFEHSLRTIQPPVAVVDPNLNFHNRSKPKDCEPEQVTKLAQVGGFDASFNAFHHQAVDHVLPYPTKFDSVSWYYSQLYIILRSDVMFHGGVVGDTRLTAVNFDHRDYPRENDLQMAIKTAVDDIRKEVPDKYHNISEPILQQWLKTNRWPPGDFYCNRVPMPNTLIQHVPYQGQLH